MNPPTYGATTPAIQHGTALLGLIRRHATVVVLCVVTVLNGLVDLWDQGLRLSTVAGFVAAFALLALDRWPWLVVAVVCACAGTHAAMDQIGAGTVALLLTATIATQRGMFAATGILVAWYAVCATLALTGDNYSLLAAMVGIVAITVAVAIGLILRSTDQRLDRAEEARTHALRRQRLVIAQELHDTVTRSTTQMVLLAEEARVKLEAVTQARTRVDPTAPPTGTEDLSTLLGEIVTLGRDSVTDLRSLLRVLQEEDETGLRPARATTTTEPEDLDQVLSAVSTQLSVGGLTVLTGVTGDPARLRHGTVLNLAQVLGECASNMLKYASNAEDSVIQVEIGAREVGLVVVSPLDNDAPITHDPALSTGMGLAHIHQRIRALGGRVSVTNTPERWMLEVHVPLSATRAAKV